jgi:hypothetical protein
VAAILVVPTVTDKMIATARDKERRTMIVLEQLKRL